MKFKDKFDVQLFLWIGLACFNLPEQKIWIFFLMNKPLQVLLSVR